MQAPAAPLARIALAQDACARFGRLHLRALGSSMSVSYTHLDVYKSQTLAPAAFSAAISAVRNPHEDRHNPRKPKPKPDDGKMIDWSASLGTGSGVNGVYPAKYLSLIHI